MVARRSGWSGCCGSVLNFCSTGQFVGPGTRRFREPLSTLCQPSVATTRTEDRSGKNVEKTAGDRNRHRQRYDPRHRNPPDHGLVKTAAAFAAVPAIVPAMPAVTTWVGLTGNPGQSGSADQGSRDQFGRGAFGRRQMRVSDTLAERFDAPPPRQSALRMRTHHGAYSTAPLRFLWIFLAWVLSSGGACLLCSTFFISAISR